MVLGSQIKKHRSDMKLSQEELAEKIYVTRQTVSNWENDKSYPDIHSLLLLCTLFDVSLDQLVKGDIETMKKEIKNSDIIKFRQYSTILSILFIATLLSTISMLIWFHVYTVLCTLVIWGITMCVAWKTEKLKKENDIHTYKEIMAFMNGKTLDAPQKQQEIGKRPYQQFLLAVGSGLLVIILAMVVHLFKK